MSADNIQYPYSKFTKVQLRESELILGTETNQDVIISAKYLSDF